MMEALVCHPLGMLREQSFDTVVLIKNRHNQSPNATIKEETSSRGQLHCNVVIESVLTASI